jgi:cytochrome d ubiquinol oxidase subunit I
MLALPFPYIANTSGWFTAELGRQPWLAFGVLRTGSGGSPALDGGTVLFTLIGLSGLYLILGMLYLVLVLREAAHGPEADADPLGMPRASDPGASGHEMAVLD